MCQIDIEAFGEKKSSLTFRDIHVYVDRKSISGHYFESGQGNTFESDSLEPVKFSIHTFHLMFLFKSDVVDWVLIFID